ncbi:unnamed protein product [marine sediment metagenome]|uniref:Uncharacterized protein n=1 Tax=marine sediment metagenome TaxID=412755 RepID=X1IXL9_9ZZZZ
MSDQIPEIKALGADFAEVERRIDTARAMIDLAKAAGEDTAKWEADLRAAVIKKDKWARALQERGVNTGPG